MDRSKFVSGEPKPPRPKCTTEECEGLVYHQTIKHCEDCIAKFNKSVEDARPISVSPSVGMELPHIMTIEDFQHLRGEEYSRAVGESHQANHPRPTPNDFNFE